MHTKRILLADDSLTALTMHRMILGGAGYELLIAQDGQEAFDVATAQQPDLILMDVVMPKKTGFEAVRLLRKQESLRNALPHAQRLARQVSARRNRPPAPPSAQQRPRGR